MVAYTKIVKLTPWHIDYIDIDQAEYISCSVKDKLDYVNSVVFASQPHQKFELLIVEESNYKFVVADLISILFSTQIWL